MNFTRRSNTQFATPNTMFGHNIVRAHFTSTTTVTHTRHLKVIDHLFRGWQWHEPFPGPSRDLLTLGSCLVLKSERWKEFRVGLKLTIKRSGGEGYACSEFNEILRSFSSYVKDVKQNGNKENPNDVLKLKLCKVFLIKGIFMVENKTLIVSFSWCRHNKTPSQDVPRV